MPISPISSWPSDPFGMANIRGVEVIQNKGQWLQECSQELKGAFQSLKDQKNFRSVLDLLKAFQNAHNQFVPPPKALPKEAEALYKEVEKALSDAVGDKDLRGRPTWQLNQAALERADRALDKLIQLYARNA